VAPGSVPPGCPLWVLVAFDAGGAGQLRRGLGCDHVFAKGHVPDLAMAGAAADRVVTFSLARMWNRCTSTVLGLR
jgi:hypothetical protein